MVFAYTSLDLLQIKGNTPSSLIDCLPGPTSDLLKELEINSIKSTRRGCRSGTHAKLYSTLVSKLIGFTYTASTVFKHVTPPISTDQIPKPDSDTGVKHVNLPNLVHSGVTHVSPPNSAGQIPVPVNTPSKCVKSETSSRPTSGLATLTSSEKPFPELPILECLLFNARSVKHKLDQLKFVQSQGCYDIIAITETWCNDSMSDSMICDSKNYNLFRTDRQNVQKSTGGGLCILTKKSIFITFSMILFAFMKLAKFYAYDAMLMF